MMLIRYKQLSIDLCGTCGAAWLDGDEVESLLGSKEAKEVVRSHDAGILDEVLGDVDILELVLEGILENLFNVS